MTGCKLRAIKIFCRKRTDCIALSEIRSDDYLRGREKQPEEKKENYYRDCTNGNNVVLPFVYHARQCSKFGINWQARASLDSLSDRFDTRLMGIIAGLIGLFIGSFLNVLIDRLPKGQNVLWGRSHCDYCKRNLRWYELIPVISFIIQGGKCRRCKKRLSLQYPSVEIFTALGYFICYTIFPAAPVFVICSIVIFSSFLVMFGSDYKYQIIPDSMIVLGILASLTELFIYSTRNDIIIHAVSALSAFVFFYLLWFITKKRGIGLGDVKLSFLLGLLLGYPQTILALYAAFLTGALAGVILILGGKKSLKSKIAFGPFLIFGILIVLLWNQQLLHIWNTIF